MFSPACLAACVWRVCAAKVSRRLIFFRRSLMQWTDKRVGLMNEVINSIQMIKFYAWESSFKAAVMDVRRKEAGILKDMIWWQSLFTMLLFSGPVMMAVAVFAVYAISGHVFTAATGKPVMSASNRLLAVALVAKMLVGALLSLYRVRTPNSLCDRCPGF